MTRKWAVFLCFFYFALSPARAQWQRQASGTDVQLRGISAVSSRVAWASGAKGTVLRTTDGGATWIKVNVPGAEALDFRDVQAFDENQAFVLSIGPGEQSRIYKTTDGGKSWRLEFANKDPKAFYDCFAFWDSRHGIAVSDSVDGKFALISTNDGKTWKPIAVKSMPAALPNEGAFAASGTCITTFGKNDVWFGTGGPAARVFHSSDRGKNWTAAETPILHGAASQGIFSLLFWSSKDGAIVGGDYQQPDKIEGTAAVTHDAGISWSLASPVPHGYRSAIARVMLGSPPAASLPTLVAVGTSGLDYSRNNGATWTSLLQDQPSSVEEKPVDEKSVDEKQPYNAISCAAGFCWAVGPAGRIARLPHPPHASVH
jgi:photosystem II stability/assembly factor-like uncharacterized protein